MNTNATIKQLADFLKQPIPYVTAFVNIGKTLGLVKEVGREKKSGKGKSSMVYQMPVEWFGENAPKINQEVATTEEVYDTSYDPWMDVDFMGDGYKDYLEETAQPCDSELLKNYTGEKEDWQVSATERGYL